MDYKTNSTGVSSAACDAAIAGESDPGMKSILLFRRAFVEDAQGDFHRYPVALADLDLSIKLLPGNWAALHERAYLYVEYGRWSEALADLNAQILIDKNDPGAFRERALARFRLGDLQGSYDDRDATINAGDHNPGAYLARARAALWLGRFDAVKSDIALGERADATGKGAGEIGDLKQELALWNASAPAARGCVMRSMPGPDANPNLIGDCTQAFLQAGTAKARADALTTRAEGWLMLRQDEDRWRQDLEIAAAFDPADAGAQANLGYAFMRNRHSVAAATAFDRSIAIAPAFYNYAGRAAARFNLGDLDGAESDARQSNALQANEIALTILGDVAHARTKTFDKARDFWIAAYKLGDRDDGLMSRLKDAGVTVPPP
jgi:tetratricopeptide (TPR) repeat protein